MPTPVDTVSHAESIRVHGLVQGVGLRPTVYRLARQRGLRGTVCNDGGGVTIVVDGASAHIDDFVRALRTQAPPLARIDHIERAPCERVADDGFHIQPSIAAPVRTSVSPDAATCPACLHELHDPSSRRAHHPFINCTDCGPRFSIVHSLPYDRDRTSMAGFAMCAECQREYHDAGDRRFHAQPNACRRCGPRLRTFDFARDATGSDGDEAALRRTVAWLRAGRIVAIKGLGGYQLACDATNEDTVALLRKRKRRPDKPFALLARDAAMVERHAVVSALERSWLESAAAPIVLVAARVPPASCIGEPSPVRGLAASIAPRQHTLGFMLPHSALHHLLMAHLDAPMVLTSGNAVDEPQCIDDDDARARLGTIADGLLLHDRAIVNRVDDSVMRVVAGSVRVLRRGRGLAPATLALPPGFEVAPPVLALGGELKNTICLLRAGQATLSQHLGDLDNPRANAAFVDTVALYQRLFEHRAEVIAVDRHPDFRAGRWGRDRAAAEGLALVEVQHHHAHLAACLAEHSVPLDAPPVLGIALDGLGWGDDGTLWGGEFMRADYRGFERLASFLPVPMPGGEQAIREPWRMAWAYLDRHPDSAALQRKFAALACLARLHERPLRSLAAMQRAAINCPLTSSCGRLFDAVAALLGVCSEASYEGQPAIELEACVDAAAFVRGDGYAFDVSARHIDPAPMWTALLADLHAGVEVGVIAARFHLGLVQAVATMVQRLVRGGTEATRPWQPRIVLSGGVFQNALLLTALTRCLQANGFDVLSPSRVPPNDGGLALGQAVVAAALSITSTHHGQPCASVSPLK